MAGKVRRKGVKRQTLTLAEASAALPEVLRLYDDPNPLTADPRRLADGIERIRLHLQSVTGSEVSDKDVNEVMAANNVGAEAWWKAALGYEPSGLPALTSAKRTCLVCGEVKRGIPDFFDLETCKSCAGKD